MVRHYDIDLVTTVSILGRSNIPPVVCCGTAGGSSKLWLTAGIGGITGGWRSFALELPFGRSTDIRLRDLLSIDLLSSDWRAFTTAGLGDAENGK